MPSILCIEDEADFRENLVELLKQEQYDVLEAGNGNEGLERYLEHRPDLVICDINMPGMDGLSLLNELHSLQPDTASRTPFIYITALHDKGVQLSSTEAGCDLFLTKPVDFDQLLAGVKAQLRKRAQLENSYQQQFNQFQSDMLSVLTHQLQSPLHNIITYTQLLKDASGDAVSKFNRRIYEVANDQLSTVENVMDTLAIGLKEVSYTDAPNNLPALLWESYQQACHDQHITRDQIRCDEGLPLINVDHNLWLRMLKHLISDAAQESVERTPYVSAKFARNTIIICIAGQRSYALQSSLEHAIPFMTNTNIMNMRELMQFRGANIHFARAVLDMYGGTLHLDTSRLYHPVLFLKLPTSILMASHS